MGSSGIRPHAPRHHRSGRRRAAAHDRERTLSLVANGEIYNYLELRTDLQQRGGHFSTRSDSETILQAYAVHGRRFIDRLHGMFAFALYDHNEKTVVLARDRLGIKPLHYLVLPDKILFASELKALLPFVPGAPEVNPAALTQVLKAQYNTGRDTIIRGIHRVLPGEIVTIDSHLNMAFKRYWSVLDIEPRSCGYEDARDRFDQLMATVIREHLRSDVPIGMFLSGGVDSSILLALLQPHLDRPIRTFSVGFSDVRLAGELDAAKRVAEQFRTDHTALSFDRRTIFHRLPYAVWAADDLLRDYACLPTSLLAEQAAAELKVVFTGEGGDEAFAGYNRYRRSGPRRWLENRLVPGARCYPFRKRWEWTLENEVFGPELRSAAAAAGEPLIVPWKSSPRAWGFVRRSQHSDICTELADGLLVKVDRMLMSFGLEGRVPFLDHRVVEFGLSLPDRLKIRSHHGKVFLKHWGERHFEKEHLWREKKGFRVPVGEWMQGSFLDALADKLPESPAIRRWFHADGIRRLFQLQRRGKKLHKEIWGLMQFAVWHRIFIENRGSVPSLDEDPLDWIGRQGN